MKISKNIIKKLKKRDKKAFEWLFNQYSEIFKSIAFRYIKNMELADDLVQEAFLTIYEKIDQYEGRGSFEGWIKRILINLALQQFKNTRKDLNELLENDNIADEIEEEEDINLSDPKSVILNTEFTKDEIYKVISELPDGFRIVFSLYVLEGFKHKEIAQMLGISENTSKTQLLRARLQLQKKLYKLALEKQKNIQQQNYLNLLNLKTKK